MTQEIRMDDWEEAIRRPAHAIWESEGRPDVKVIGIGSRQTRSFVIRSKSSRRPPRGNQKRREPMTAATPDDKLIL